MNNLNKLCNLSALKQFSADQNRVSLALAKHVIRSTKDTNLFLSPTSIHVPLSMVASGSTGRAQREILSYLKCNSSNELNLSMSRLMKELFADGSSAGGPILSSANGIWVDKRFALKPKFKEIVDDVYKAGVEQVDFMNKADAVEKVNTWTREKTNGLIKQILGPGSVHEFTRLICGNAIYFKGAWTEPFDEEYTEDYKFYLLNGKSTEVPYMVSCDDQYLSAFDGFKVLGLPYEHGKDGRRFSMYIYLPDSKDGLHDLVEKVTSEPGFIEQHLPRLRKVEHIRVPKFKIDFDFEASEVLNKLGVVSAFDGGLTEIVDDEVDISRIIHKAFIEVNEEGTKAAAVSVYDGGGTCCSYKYRPKQLMNFVAQHPFLFVIRENTTGAILFVGQVLNPL